MQHDPDYDDETPPSEPSALKEVVVTILAALLLAYLAQGFVVKPYRIPSGSMENTLRCGDRVLVDRVSYHFSDPDRFDVIVFHPPAGLNEKGDPDPALPAGEGGELPPRDAEGRRVLQPAKVNYIKRVIGLPGDRIQVRKHRAIVNGKSLKEPFMRPLPKDEPLDSSGEFPSTDESESYVVPKNTYFVMGDHRDNSRDGRVFLAIPREFVVGQAFMVYWPLKRVGGLPDEDPGDSGSSAADPNCLGSALSQNGASSAEADRGA